MTVLLVLLVEINYLKMIICPVIISKMFFKVLALLLILLLSSVASSTISPLAGVPSARSLAQQAMALRQLQEVSLSSRQSVLLLNRFDAVLYFQLK